VSESFIRSNESVEKFIEALEARQLLSVRLIGKMRDKVAQSERPLTAKALAKFLVDKNHLTQQQATEVLGGLVRSGVDVDPAPDDAVAAEHDAEEVVPLVSSAPPVQRPDDSLPQLAADDAEDYEGSSIFEPFPVEKPEPIEPDEELGLAPGSEADMPVAARDVPEPDEPAGVVELPQLPERKPPNKKAGNRDLSADADRVSLGEPLAESAANAPATVGARVKRLKNKKPPKRTNEWDSPLLLLGGGGLALLIIGGATIAWLLSWESGDEKLRLAEESLNSGSYTQAVTHYQEFLERHPRHRDRSLARVKLATARLRKATEAGNYSLALATAQEELQEIENEEKFSDAHAELAALLPRIALGLAKEAESATEPAEAEQLIERSNSALALANSTKFVPKSLRDEAELNDVRETLARIERRQQSQQDLEKALAAMNEAITAGDTRIAYAHHAKFVKQRPELAVDARIAEMVQKAAAAEQAAIQFVHEEKLAETAERPTPWLTSLAVANRRTKPDAAPAQAATGAAVLRIDGAVYGFDVATGRLLWRRHVGHARSTWPISVDANVLVADTTRHELLLLESTTGRLLWRQSIGEPFTSPLIVKGRGFLAAESGRFYVIDLASGTRAGYLQFAQPLRVAPTTDRRQERLYLTGDHSSLYTISLEDLSCLGVYYLGHAEGSVTVSPAAVMNKLAVLENDGVRTSRLRLLNLDDQGSVAGQAAERRLAGLATASPFVAGRRLIVTTDRGLIEVYEVADGAEPLTLIAARAGAGDEPLIRYATVIGSHIWVADTQLNKYSILPTGNRLPVESLPKNFAGSTFTHPIRLHGDVIVHGRRRKGRAGATVGATDTRHGRTLWETDVAMPPAGSPVVDDSTRALLLASAEGNLFRFDEAAIRSRVQDEPLSARAMPADLPPLSASLNLGQGRAVFAALDSDRLLIYTPSRRDAPIQWIQLPGAVACDPTPFGNGIVVPTRLGQVFYLGVNDGSSLATPFQPPLQPGASYAYKPAAVVDQDPRQLVLTDGQKVYLIALRDQPQPHLAAVAETSIAGQPIESAFTVVGETAMAIAGSSHLVRLRLPSLETASEANLTAPVVWGPHRAGSMVVLATANGRLIGLTADGDMAWQEAIEHGNLVGVPLLIEDSLLLAYREGVIERRALSNGQPLAAKDLEHPLAAGPISFLNRLVLTTTDGTLLVAESP
jgi:tetratricopeptide (TPR) repeat protein